MSLPVPHLNAIAVDKVKRHARDKADERWLLDVIGLVDEDGAIKPDDTNVYTFPAADKGPGAKDPAGRTATSTTRDRSTVPEGLANLQPIEEQDPPKKRRGPKPQPKVIRPAKPRTVPQCGEYKAFSRHKRLGEPVDEACMEAYRTYHREHGVEYRLRKRKEAERKRLIAEGVNPESAATMSELVR